MERRNLFDLMQNTAISAIAMQSFTLGYYSIAKNKKSIRLYPKLEYMFYVLPVVYNKDARDIFVSSNELYTALTKNPAIILGLQERANKMALQTFNGLNLAFSKNILTINKETNSIELLRGYQTKKLPLSLELNNSYNSVKKIQDGAFKLGSIFAKKNEKNIQIQLNIRF